MMDAGRPAAFVAIAVLGALLLAGLLVILRVLGRRVAIEEAEELLRAEFERDEEANRSGWDEALTLPPRRPAGARVSAPKSEKGM